MPHRYWRITFNRGVDSSDSVVGPLGEIEMRGSIGGADLTGGGTPSVSHITTGTAANLFDNNGGTSWHSNTVSVDQIHVTYDFGTDVDVAELVITATSDAGSLTQRRPSSNLSWSDDGLVWQVLAPSFDTSALHTSAVVTVSGFVLPIDGHVVTDGIRLDTAWPTDTAEGRVVGESVRHDAIDGGALEISGTVMIDDSPDIPVRRQVRLFQKQSGRLVRETWSEAATGEYVFSNLKDQKYFVVSHDHTLFYNAVIKDEITPEVPA